MYLSHCRFDDDRQDHRDPVLEHQKGVEQERIPKPPHRDSPCRFVDDRPSQLDSALEHLKGVEQERIPEPPYWVDHLQHRNLSPRHFPRLEIRLACPWLPSSCG